MFKSAYRLLTLATLFFLFSNCQPQKPEIEEKTAPAFRYKKEQHHFSKASEGCKTDSNECAIVAMNYPQFKEDGAVFARINDSILHYVKASLTFEDEKLSNDMDLDALGNRFIQDYNEYSAEAKTRAEEDNSELFITPWNIETDGAIIFESPKVVSIRLDEYAYTGGAHPNSNTALLMYSTSTGKPMKLKDLVKNQAQLERLVEKKFRETHELAPNANLNDKGFFWEGKFQLPANIGIVAEGMLFFYNSYEIAAYAVGPTGFVLSWEELGTLIDTNKLK